METLSRKTIKKCNFTLLLEAKGWSVEEAATALGDSPLRLYRVLEGLEPMGRTATLAALALKHNIDPIE